MTGAESAFTSNGVVMPLAASSPVRLPVTSPIFLYVHGTVTPLQLAGLGGRETFRVTDDGELVNRTSPAGCARDAGLPRGATGCGRAPPAARRSFAAWRCRRRPPGGPRRPSRR